MANNPKDSLDWWQKPDHLDNKGKGKGKRPTKRSPKEGLTRGQFALRIAINGVILGVLGLLIAVGAHFTLQGLTRHGASCTVPQLLDLTLSEAEVLAAENDLHLVINDSLYAPGVGRGVILAQLPAEGTVVKPGRSIYLSINAMHERMVNVPYVAGRSLRQAKNMLEVAGLIIDHLDYEEDLATNYILGQSYKGREITEKSTMQLPAGSGVTLRVGVARGDNSTVVPDVMGRTIHAARSALWSAGINVGEIRAEADINRGNEHLAMVYRQSIPADSTVTLGRSVALRLTLHKSVIDSAYKEMAREEIFKAKMLEREKFIADSLAMFEMVVDTVVVEEPKRRPTAKKVEFEDLF